MDSSGVSAAKHQSGVSLLATKLLVPQVRRALVARPRLAAHLDRALDRRLTVISAPAGFGKTTAVAAWVRGVGVPVAWLSLDEADNDSTRFLVYLVAALQQIDPTVGQDLQAALGTSAVPPIDAALDVLTNGIAARAGDFALVLDDFHTINEATILAAIRHMVSHQPHNLHLVLVTREDPSLPLARLRALGELVELRARDLRFTPEEAFKFLREVVGLALDMHDVDVLVARTEGWVAGLQLAGIAAREHDNPSAYIAGLGGSHRYILSYLTEEVLGRQTEEVLRFLLQTSILDRLSADLCDAVLGSADSASVLERLVAANLFLMPLDDEGRWFRYHRLFADLLVNRLRLSLPADAIQELHCRASEWLALNDDLDEAIRHSLEAGKYDRAACMVEQVAEPMMSAGRAGVLTQWLEALPDTCFRTRPRLTVFRTWINLMQGKSDLSEQGLRETERLLRALPPSAENERLQRELTVMLSRFVALSGNTSRAIQLAEEAMSFLPADDLGARARVTSALAGARALEGNAEAAEQAYQECMRLAVATGNYSLAAHTTVVKARVRCDYGRLREAAGAYQSIVEMGESSGQRVFFPAGQGYIGLADIHLEWNELEKAEDYLARGTDLCRRGGLAGAFAGHAVRSRLLQAKGDLAGALAETRPLGRDVQAGVDPSGIARQIQVRLAMGDVDEAAHLAAPWITMLDVGPNRARTPLLALEVIETVVARVFLARGEIERAVEVLENLQSTAEPGGRIGRLIEVHLLKALAEQKRNGGSATPAALEHFEHALELAEPEGYALIFLEEGEMAISLMEAVARGPVAPALVTRYARKLLGSFRQSDEGIGRPATETAVAADAAQALTQRELEVLGLICDGCSNAEIAERLVVTVSAVKKHTGSIFGKLDVSSRTQAIARARQLRLLSKSE